MCLKLYYKIFKYLYPLLFSVQMNSNLIKQFITFLIKKIRIE